MRKHRVTVRAVKKQPPDLDRFTAALLALAITRVEQQQVEQASQQQSKEARG